LVQIVPPQEVLDNQAIHTEKWTLYGLGNAMTDSDSIFKWLAAHRLIKTYFPHFGGGTSIGMMTNSMCYISFSIQYTSTNKTDGNPID
jgi:hypothetical protein